MANNYSRSETFFVIFFFTSHAWNFHILFFYLLFALETKRILFKLISFSLHPTSHYFVHCLTVATNPLIFGSFKFSRANLMKRIITEIALKHFLGSKSPFTALTTNFNLVSRLNNHTLRDTFFKLGVSSHIIMD